MIIKSLYTIESYKAFQKLLYKKIKILSYITSFILVILGVILIYFGFFGYSYVVLGVALPIFIHVFTRYIENESIKKNSLLMQSVSQTFHFREDRVKLHQTSIVSTFEDEYFYNELVSVYKNKKYYFLFVTRTQAFIVDKEGFISGNEKELDELLKNVLKEKFINKCPVK